MGAPRLHFEQLTYRHPGASHPCVEGVSGELRAGEWVCLAGANGSGKSSLMRLLAGLRTPASGRIACTPDGASHGPTEPGFRRAVAYLAQSPQEQLFGRTVFDELAAGLEWHAVPPAEIRARVAAACASLGLPPGAETDRLSHGQKHVLALRAATLAGPAVLLADEPLDGLDPHARARWLRELRALLDSGVAVLTAGVSAAEASHADHAWLLRAGGRGLVEVAPDTLLDPAAALAAGLRPVPRESDLLPGGEIADAGGDASILLRGIQPSRSSGPLWPPLDLGIPARGLVAVWGRNGCGKTTLALALAGLLETGGVVERGALGWARQAGVRRCWSAMAFENAEDQMGEGSVAEELQSGSADAARFEAGVAHLARLGMADPAMLARSPWTLSGGERRRVALAALASAAPDWLILDEPFGGLDGEGAGRLAGWLREEGSRRATWIFSADLDVPGVPIGSWLELGSAGLGRLGRLRCDGELADYLPWAYGQASRIRPETGYVPEVQGELSPNRETC